MMEKKRLGFELKQLSNLVKRNLEQTMAESQGTLTAMQHWIIRYLFCNADRDVFQRDIEAEFKIRRSTVTGILKLMEKNGLLERRGVEKDGRLKKLVLTQKAIDLHETAMEIMQSMEERLTRGLSEEELTFLFAIIDKMKKNMEQRND